MRLDINARLNELAITNFGSILLSQNYFDKFTCKHLLQD